MLSLVTLTPCTLIDKNKPNQTKLKYLQKVIHVILC